MNLKRPRLTPPGLIREVQHIRSRYRPVVINATAAALARFELSTEPPRDTYALVGPAPGAIGSQRAQAPRLERQGSSNALSLPILGTVRWRLVTLSSPPLGRSSSSRRLKCGLRWAAMRWLAFDFSPVWSRNSVVWNCLKGIRCSMNAREKGIRYCIPKGYCIIP